MKLFTRYEVVDDGESWNEPIALQVLRSVALCWLAYSMMNGSLYAASQDAIRTMTELWLGLQSWLGPL
jgi:hypothetical protein